MRGQIDQELVASDPAHHVLAPHAAVQPLCHHPQELVPSGVPQLVVHVLEVVEVDEDHRRALARAVGGEHRLELCHGRGAVVAAGAPRRRWPVPAAPRGAGALGDVRQAHDGPGDPPEASVRVLKFKAQ